MMDKSSKPNSNNWTAYIFWVFGCFFTMGFAPYTGEASGLAQGMAYALVWPLILGEALRITAGG